MAEKRDAPAERTGDRAPYVTPEIAWEDELGTRPGLVAACGKVAIETPACQTSGSAS